ncbi:DUF4430 domain-containing protein [Aquibacillus saliphilus]|uniref:DUF4430 domain-containing protein n=1 Tax=Aquibacillus saliphilus TaxID=1909422 RepID=UPI001CF0B925|nr:DUF4430 domain-containing protein [Aquibacillus saliphilus]
MNNKFYLSILSTLIAIFILAGCQQDGSSSEQSENQETEQTSETQNEETAIVTISQDNGEEIVAEEEIAFEEGAVLMDVMKDNFDVEGTDQGFITSIEGISQDDESGKYWMYSINGEMPTVGANEYELEVGDQITFDLQAME